MSKFKSLSSIRDTETRHESRPALRGTPSPTSTGHTGSKKYHNPLVRNFLDKIRAEDGLSLNTILSYQKDLQLFDTFLTTKKITLEKVTTDDIKDYLYDLHQQDLKSASVSRKISCLKNFYGFLESENLIKSNPALYLQGQKRESRLPKFLTEKEVFKLLDFTNRDQSEFGIKLSCMLEVLYSAGLRVTELVSLPISAIAEIEENGKKNFA